MTNDYLYSAFNILLEKIALSTQFYLLSNCSWSVTSHCNAMVFPGPNVSENSAATDLHTSKLISHNATCEIKKTLL